MRKNMSWVTQWIELESEDLIEVTKMLLNFEFVLENANDLSSGLFRNCFHQIMRFSGSLLTAEKLYTTVSHTVRTPPEYYMSKVNNQSSLWRQKLNTQWKIATNSYQACWLETWTLIQSTRNLNSPTNKFQDVWMINYKWN